MKRIYFIVLICLSTPAFSQSKAKQEHTSGLRSTELHLGISLHKLAHFGIRKYLGYHIMLEGDIGVGPGGVDRSATALSIGVGVPFSEIHPCLYLSVNYSRIEIEYHYHKKHIIAGNIGWLIQHDNVSFLGKIGGAPVGGHEWVPFNVEVSLGMAF